MTNFLKKLKKLLLKLWWQLVVIFLSCKKKRLRRISYVELSIHPLFLLNAKDPTTSMSLKDYISEEYLFSLPKNEKDSLNFGKISKSIQEEFAKYLIFLPQETTVEFVKTDTEWKIIYGGENRIIKKEGSVLNVYNREPHPNEDKIIPYLKNGYVLRHYPFNFVSECFDKYTIISKLTLFTDGTWAWRDGLAYYVETYHLELPPEFTAHMASNNWEIPSKEKINFKKLFGFDPSFGNEEGSSGRKFRALE